jgi:hypothetical protein
MPWATTDQSDLTEVLELDYTQELPNSILRSLMDEVDRRNSGRIPSIQGWMTQLKALIELERTQLSAIANSATAATAGQIKREKIDAVSEMEYFSGSDANQSIPARSKLKGRLRQDIIRFLDPYGYLNRYKGKGRAVDGV